VLFIDASNEFEKVKNQNVLREEDLEKIIDTYKSRVEIEKYSHLAALQELEENEYNLNIPRYVDTYTEDEEIDLKEVSDKLKEIEKESKIIDEKIK
jgi:type I restriction enzyme M protein